jgi:hypothetical protein
MSNTPYGDMVSKVTREQREYYNESYRPVAQQLIKDTESTAIVDAAVKEASVDNTAAISARRDRQKARLGIVKDGVGAGLGQYKTALNRTLQGDGSINNARLQQDERNTGLTNDLVAISRGISSDANKGMLDAAGNEAARNSTNANIAAQNAAAKKQQQAMALSLMLMMI